MLSAYGAARAGRGLAWRPAALRPIVKTDRRVRDIRLAGAGPVC